MKDLNSEKERLRFHGLNNKCFCIEHTPFPYSKQRNLMKQIYYRRYAINFDNTSSLTYEEFCLKYSYEKFSTK